MSVNPVTKAPVTWRPLPDAELVALHPLVTPRGWEHLAGMYWQSVELTVGLDAGWEEDGRRWMHLSVSRRTGAMPRWMDLVQARRLFVPRHLTALQVLPCEQEHYDAHLAGHTRTQHHVLHLWACLDGDVTPNFLRARGWTL